MLNKIKLKNRILLGYAAPIVLSLIGSTIVYWNFNDAKNASKKVNDASSILENIQSTAFHLATIQKTSRGYLLAKTDTSFNAYQKNVELFKEKSQIVDNLIVDPEQKKLAQQITSLGDEVIDYNNNLINLVNQGKTDEAIRIWRSGKGRQLSARLDELLTDFVSKESEILNERKDLQINYLNTIILTKIIVVSLSIVLSIVIGTLIANAITNQINKTVNQVALTSNEIAGSVEEQEITIAEQASSVSDTTTTIEQLGATTRQTAQQADVSTQKAHQALELSESGKKSVNMTMEGIGDLQNQVTEIANQIIRLSEQTEQISTVSDLVGDVANQTNMLALNAAVEAARAGEQGKGFTVVAGEIRKLADQSKKSAEKINSLVGEIQASINSTVMVTDQGSKKATEGIKLAEGTAEVFQEIAEAINNVFMNSQQISMSSKQQAVAVQQVVSAMNAINLGARENSTSISQVKSATSDLYQSAEQLKASI